MSELDKIIEALENAKINLVFANNRVRRLPFEDRIKLEEKIHKIISLTEQTKSTIKRRRGQ